MINVVSVKRQFDDHNDVEHGAETDRYHGVAVQNSVRHFPAGWWLLPSAALGCVAWFLIFRAIWAWLA